METKNLIKNMLGKNLTKLYLLISKAQDDSLQVFNVRYASLE